jgi:hypothetical protein
LGQITKLLDKLKSGSLMAISDAEPDIVLRAENKARLHSLMMPGSTQQ